MTYKGFTEKQKQELSDYARKFVGGSGLNLFGMGSEKETAGLQSADFSRKLTEAQKIKICGYIKESLTVARLKHLCVAGLKSLRVDDGTGEKLKLVDLLSLGGPIKDGQEEIENLVEAICSDMGEWDI